MGRRGGKDDAPARGVLRAGARWDKIPALVHRDISDDHIHSIRLQAHLLGPRAFTVLASAAGGREERQNELFEADVLTERDRDALGGPKERINQIRRIAGGRMIDTKATRRCVQDSHVRR